MYENAFNSIERELRNEAGIANELDYVEQISWVLFLKYLHDLEAERRDRGGPERRDLRAPYRAGFPVGRLGGAQDARRRVRP